MPQLALSLFREVTKDTPLLPVPPDMKILGFMLCRLLVLLPPCQGLPGFRTERKTVAFGHRTGMWLPSVQWHRAPGEVDPSQKAYAQLVLHCLHAVLQFVTEKVMNLNISHIWIFESEGHDKVGQLLGQSVNRARLEWTHSKMSLTRDLEVRETLQYSQC